MGWRDKLPSFWVKLKIFTWKSVPRDIPVTSKRTEVRNFPVLLLATPERTEVHNFPVLSVKIYWSVNKWYINIS